MSEGINKPRWALIASGIMDAKGLRYGDVKKAMKVSTASAVGHYFNGRREPSIEQLSALARQLGVMTSHLTGEIPLSPDPQESAEIERLLWDLDPGSRPLILAMLRTAAGKGNGVES